MSADRQCNACLETKPVSEFYKAPLGADGLERRCKDCKKAGKKGPRGKQAAPPQASAAPSFLSVETSESYVINGGDGTAIELQASEVEEIFQWWKAKRKAA